jgi:glutathione S-transferase
MPVVLHGYRYSVYHRIARMALVEKGVAHSQVEVDPFAAEVPAEYVAMHPFRRVPTLVHGDLVLYETSAITRYVDEGFEGPALQPTGARARARMNQVISIVDSYGYWPMVRQVFSHRVFRSRSGEPVDEGEVQKGLEAATRVLSALETLASPRTFLVGESLTLADLYLAPMLAYFTAAQEGRLALRKHQALSQWWQRMQSRESLRDTAPGLPGD